jgi:hypothetical protein
MSNYKLGYFIVPTDENSTGVKIKDKFGSIRYSINPQMVTVMFVKVNVINVRTKSSNNSILIDFATNSEAKLALVELRLEMDKIKNRIIKEEIKQETLIQQLDTGADFLSIYTSGTQSSGTQSGTQSGGTQSNLTMTDRITQLVSKISDDFNFLKNQENIQISLNPVDDFDESIDDHIDILDYEFFDKSDGIPNIYINGVYLFLGTSSESIAYISDGNNIYNTIEPNTRLYINPYLLDYPIETTDVITLHYMKN